MFTRRDFWKRGTTVPKSVPMGREEGGPTSKIRKIVFISFSKKFKKLSHNDICRYVVTKFET
jgi:hypothetical protein